MSPNVHRRMLFYLSNLTMFAIFTSLLTGFNLIQFEKSDQLTRIGVPRPRQTEAEWCSAVLLGHADSDSSTVEDLFALDTNFGLILITRNHSLIIYITLMDSQKNLKKTLVAIIV